MQVVVIVCFLHCALSLTCQEEMVYSKPYGYVYSIACHQLNDTNMQQLKSIVTQYKVRLALDHSVLTKLSSSTFKTIPNTVELIVTNSIVPKLNFVPKTLMRLSLVNNSLSVLESNFTSLHQLQFVNLSHNSLSTLPSGILRVTMEELDLSHNKFENFDVACEVTRVKRLYLSHNQIRTLDKFPLKCLPVLDQLHLDFNNIAELSQLKTLSYVTKLFLNNNNISTIGHAFTSLENLSQLNLAGNKIKTIAAYNFQNAYQLKTLNLQGNLIENVTLRSLNIEELNLEDNNFQLPPNLSLHALKELRVSHNNLPRVNFSSFTKLIRLHLSNCTISVVSQRLQSLVNLQFLDLSFNALELNGSDFAHLDNLRELDLSGNNLQAVPNSAFSSQSSLEKLNLSRNNLKEFSEVELVSLAELRVLDLSFNLLEHVDERNLKFLENLEELYVDHNRLKYIEYNFIVGYLQEVRVFDIRYNDFPCQFLTDMVTYLNISRIAFGDGGKALGFHENVAGIHCQETGGSGSVNVALVLLIAALLSFLLVFISYCFYLFLGKNRRDIDEIELIRDRGVSYQRMLTIY